ncbi:MAG TPA: hypothetical protein VI485_18675, partial [Vicinamibacterales bacterium]|nr:hypothetical protein [Vicinamibacterales bacterium]
MLALAVVAAVFAAGLRAAGQAVPDDPAAQYQLASQLYESAQYREALGAYELATHSDDEDLVARARKGKVRTALRIAEFDVAWREAEILTAGAVADGEARTLLGDALWANGRFDEAD